MAGRAARARREFTKAVALNPSDDYAHFALALACERTGQRQRALGHAKLANAMHPGVPDYEVALARLSAA
jgi:Flp pilus assembly protein TadD